MTATLEPLRHIREVNVLNPGFQASLEKVGEFLAQECLTFLFAVQVGHLHFGLSSNEALWEVFNEPTRELMTRVVKRGAVNEEQPVAWQFTTGGKAVPFIWSGQALGLTTKSAEAQAALTKVGEFFARERLTRDMTLRVLRASIPVYPDEAALETTNIPARTQLIRPVSLSTVKAKEASTWRFTRKGQPIEMAWCYPVDVEHNGDHDVEEGK